MSDIVIRVENLSKRYLIGQASQGSYRTFRDALTGKAKALQHWFRPAPRQQAAAPTEEFWALQDVSFEIRQGDRVGIIGRNGAGKSTLLKILSRITEPTRGRVTIRGRVASLLEVGTGFHPELTGRENVFLNGAVLGMGRVEIRKKFDEIVAFAEVEKFIDTPVKRYSSGMYVRLAFAVAAYLEPEILIVDEVLAVGDAQFQQKCLGKMEDVSTKEGRTVLFVSHNMQAVSQLTNHCIMLSQGQKYFEGRTDQALMTYLLLEKKNADQSGYYTAPSGQTGNFLSQVQIKTSEGQGIHQWGKPILFEFLLNIDHPQESLCFAFQVLNAQQQNICHFMICDSQSSFGRQKGLFRLCCKVPEFRLYMGTYTLTTWLAAKRSNTLFETLNSICHFEVDMGNSHRPEYDWQPNDCIYIEESSWEEIEMLNSYLSRSMNYALE